MTHATGFRDHFSGHSKDYGAFRPAYGDDVLAYLAGVAPGHACAWDVGTGNGQLARLLAGRFACVVATDASAAQLDEAGVHERIDFRVEPAERSSLASESVDLITVAQAAHWFDLPRFYEEVRRVSRPAGAIVLLGYELMHVTPPIDEVVRWFYRDVVGAYWPPERRHLEDGYQRLPFDFPRLPAPSPTLALHHVWSFEQLVGYVGTWSARHRAWKAMGIDPLPQFARGLRDAWPMEVEALEVVWPLSVVAGRVRG